MARSATEARYVPLEGPDGSLGAPALAALETWLEDAETAIVAHDVRDLYAVAGRYGITVRGVVGDTALGSYLVDPTGLIPHRLDQVVKQFLHRTILPPKTVIGSGKRIKQWSDIPIPDTTAYSCHLAAAIAEAWPLVDKRVAAENQREQLHDVDIPLARVLAQMGIAGIGVEPDDLRAMGEEFTTRKEEIEARIYELAGRTFNIGSPKQLAVVLFEELELPVIKQTTTGCSTAQDVLERLAPKHEIAKAVLRQRALAKLINTYTAVLQNAVSPATGRIHTTFIQTTAASGRIITTDPDLQRTPIRSEDGKRIRSAFRAKPGHQLISADWSQIELRILAHITGDAELIAAFTEGVDVHVRTASRIYDIDAQAVTPEQRNVGKTVNFATIYGQGATALGQSLGIPRAEAKRIIATYFKRYSGVRTWLDTIVASAHETGYVETLAGRRRYVTELSSGNYMTRAYGERIAGNTPIQGSAADICKLAMLQISEGLKSMKTRMLLQIHDELVFEAPDDEVAAVVAMARDRMENCWPLDVPLVVDVGWGQTWAEAKA
jgi:DNA polymerase-1